MGLKMIDQDSFTKTDFGCWLASHSAPVVILVQSSNFSQEKCQKALRTLEEVAAKPEFQEGPVFVCFDADECSELCKRLSVGRVPTVLIYRSGKEIVRFSDVINVGTIMQHLHILADPQRNHPVLPASTPA